MPAASVWYAIAVSVPSARGVRSMPLTVHVPAVQLLETLETVVASLVTFRVTMVPILHVPPKDRDVLLALLTYIGYDVIVGAGAVVSISIECAPANVPTAGRVLTVCSAVKHRTMVAPPRLSESVAT